MNKNWKAFLVHGFRNLMVAVALFNLVFYRAVLQRRGMPRYGPIHLATPEGLPQYGQWCAFALLVMTVLWAKPRWIFENFEWISHFGATAAPPSRLEAAPTETGRPPDGRPAALAAPRAALPRSHWKRRLGRLAVQLVLALAWLNVATTSMELDESGVLDHKVVDPALVEMLALGSVGNAFWLALVVTVLCWPAVCGPEPRSEPQVGGDLVE